MMDDLAGHISSTPKTSVIIPIHNTAPFLGMCLDSVLGQTQKEIEVILVDDGSTDESLEICLSYASRDKRVRVVHQESRGPGAARNNGLALARGEYIYFLDSDDYILPSLFEKCYRACKDHNLDVVAFDSRCFLDDPAEDRSDLFKFLRSRSGMIGEEVMDGPSFWNKCWSNSALFVVCWLNYINRSFALDHDLRFAEGIYYEDNDWYVRLCISTNRMQYLPHTMHRYRHRLGSITRSEYSYELARSALEEHKVLCAIARVIDDPTRLEMIGNACHLHQQFMRRFALVIPTEKAKALVNDFLEGVLADCDDPATPEAIRSMHLETLTNLADGVIGWPKQPFILTKIILQRVLGLNVSLLQDAERVGIYGTGNACEAFLWLCEPSAKHLFFLETDPSPGKSFHGRPVTCIADAANLDLDAIVITSSKYRDQMKLSVKQHLGANLPIIVVPKLIFAVRNARIIGLVEHGSIRRAQRKLRKTMGHIIPHHIKRVLKRMLRIDKHA